MTAAAFLAARGRVCVRCGMPATCRYGPDLVEPDSGVASCASCAPVVSMSVTIAVTGDLDLADRFLKPTRKGAKAMKENRERLARELGWEG